MLRYLLILLTVCPLLAAAQQGPDSLWEPLPLHFDWQVGKLYPDPKTGDLYITRFMGAVNGRDSCIVRWDGSSASLIPTPFGFGFDIVRYKSKLMLNGQAEHFDYVMSFDGREWNILDSFDYSKGPWTLFTLDSHLVVTGYFDTIGGLPIRQAALWNNNAGWRNFYRMDTCFPGTAPIYGLERYKGEVYIGGLMFAPKGTSNIARFDGKNWKDVGGGMRGNGLSVVNCMLVWNDELYVAGQFLERDGSPGNCIAKWDGQRWHRLGGGITQFGYEAAVYDMAVYHDNLYVVGVFGEAGGVRANNIAKWDGRRWCSLHTDMRQGTPSQIKVAKGELYMSGALDTLNGKPVSHLARWAGGDYVHECGPIQAASVEEATAPVAAWLYPNPVGNMLYLKHADIETLTIYDAAGKLLRTASGTALHSGLDVSRLPSGFYFARVVLGDGTVVSARFAKQ